MTQLSLTSIAPPQMWSHIPVEDPRASKLYDDHYSRQTIGARGVLGPGWRFLLWHEGKRGTAMWGVVYGRFRKKWRWRNSIFRNDSDTRSSDLIVAATIETGDLWLRRYRVLPTVPLTTEIDIDATASRRGRTRPPGYCYACAGWVLVRFTYAEHGRTAKAIYQSVDDATPWEAFGRHWFLIGQWATIVAMAERRRLRVRA